MVPLLEMGMPFPVLEDTGLGGGRGAILRAHQKKDFGAIPYFLVITNYEKAFLYVALK